MPDRRTLVGYASPAANPAGLPLATPVLTCVKKLLDQKELHMRKPATSTANEAPPQTDEVYQLARWRRRPAATATPCTMHARQDCSPSWSWRTATVASRGCSER